MQENHIPQAGDPATKLAIRVFVLDDHPVFAEVISEILNRSGNFTVVGSANDGETALKRLEGLSVDIVLLDLLLPGIGGLEVLRALRENRFDAKFVICSGLGADKAIVEAYSQGVSAFVEKSMAVEELLSTLRAVAEGKFFLNSRMGGLLRDFVRERNVFKPISAVDMSILRLLATGQGMKEIADELGISVSGVYKARARIRSRMNIKGTEGFVYVAISLGLVNPFAWPVPLVAQGRAGGGVGTISL